MVPSAFGLLGVSEVWGNRVKKRFTKHAEQWELNMTKKERESSPVVHIDEVEEVVHTSGEHWGGGYKVLTPWMTEGGGKLGLNLSRLPPGRTTCPFHYHDLEDEAFYVISGRGVLRYGDELFELRAGHTISCPAGTKVAHQIANPYDEDMLYLAIGNREPNEVCVYPDSGKIMVRSLQTVGRLTGTEYMDGEPDNPKIFDIIKGA